MSLKELPNIEIPKINVPGGDSRSDSQSSSKSVSKPKSVKKLEKQTKESKKTIEKKSKNKKSKSVKKVKPKTVSSKTKSKSNSKKNSKKKHRKKRIKTEKVAIAPLEGSQKLRREKEIAMDFATRVHKKFDSLVKATVLFGSQAKNEATSKSDIDIIIIVDDASINWDLELIAWYREELAKLISAQKYSRDLHINTIKLTTWWNDLMHGDAVVINILRYGEVLIDIGGFFNPLKVLLMQGKIHSTPEAVYTALQRAPSHLARSKAAELGAIEGIYWTLIDSAQAALITLGKLPPSPEHIAPMLKKHFVERKALRPEFVAWFGEVYRLHKGIVHGEIRDIKGIEIDKWQERAQIFMRKMTEIIDDIIEARRHAQENP